LPAGTIGGPPRQLGYDWLKSRLIGYDTVDRAGAMSASYFLRPFAHHRFAIASAVCRHWSWCRLREVTAARFLEEFSGCGSKSDGRFLKRCANAMGTPISIHQAPRLCS
jgi:hypothetical protein